LDQAIQDLLGFDDLWFKLQPPTCSLQPIFVAKEPQALRWFSSNLADGLWEITFFCLCEGVMEESPIIFLINRIKGRWFLEGAIKSLANFARCKYLDSHWFPV